MRLFSRRRLRRELAAPIHNDSGEPLNPRVTKTIGFGWTAVGLRSIKDLQCAVLMPDARSIHGQGVATHGYSVTTQVTGSSDPSRDREGLSIANPNIKV